MESPTFFTWSPLLPPFLSSWLPWAFSLSCIPLWISYRYPPVRCPSTCLPQPVPYVCCQYELSLYSFLLFHPPSIRCFYLPPSIRILCPEMSVPLPFTVPSFRRSFCQAYGCPSPAQVSNHCMFRPCRPSGRIPCRLIRRSAPLHWEVPLLPPAQPPTFPSAILGPIYQQTLLVLYPHPPAPTLWSHPPCHTARLCSVRRLGMMPRSLLISRPLTCLLLPPPWMSYAIPLLLPLPSLTITFHGVPPL